MIIKEFLLVKIFIIYGKRKGEEIGLKVDSYFKINGLRSFLASPKSPDIKPGEDFQKRIDEELKDADVAVVIVTTGIHTSIAALDEIQRIQQMNLPHVPYAEEGTKIPLHLIKEWVLKFKKKDGGKKINNIKLELAMWRLLDSVNASNLKHTSESSEIEEEVYSPGGMFQ